MKREFTNFEFGWQISVFLVWARLTEVALCATPIIERHDPKTNTKHDSGGKKDNTSCSASGIGSCGCRPKQNYLCRADKKKNKEVKNILL